jgi:peroxin-6
MTEHIPIPNTRKRKRRRRQDKPAVNARLVLDDHVKGDVGILSEDLFKELFPAIAQGMLGNFMVRHELTETNRSK